MAFDDSTSRLAQELGEQAQRDEAAAFDARHALQREAERASSSIIARGQERLRKAAEEQERAAQKAGRTGGDDRFDDDDPDPDGRGATSTGRPSSTSAHTPPAPATPARHHRPATVEDEEDEVASHWLS